MSFHIVLAPGPVLEVLEISRLVNVLPIVADLYAPVARRLPLLARLRRTTEGPRNGGPS